MRTFLSRLGLLFLLAGAPACAVQEALAPTPTGAATEHTAMVAAANPHAVEAGLDALRNGGNAMDAAIAVQTVLSLVEPQSSGLGGGAFMLYRDAATGEITVYDGRERAPMAADETLWLDEEGEPLPFLTAWTSGRAVGVPGVIAMLAMAHEDHGARDWAENFTFAERLAEDGFAISPRLHSLILRAQQIGPIEDLPASGAYFFDENGNAFPVGHVLANPDYAESLRLIAADWRNFYEGPLAAEIVAAVGAGDVPGAMTLDDLAAYTPVRRAAICRDYRGYDVCSAPPPASGGIALNQILGLLEPYDMAATGPETEEGWRRFIEASRLAYADRDAYVAAPEAMTVTPGALLDEDYIAARAALIDRDTAIPHVPAGEPDIPGTSHFVIVDAHGNVVSMTATVEFLFGSNRMAGGFFLNNQMTDFNFDPRDEDGRLHPNAPGSGKVPRSSMSPTIILDGEGEFYMGVGSPGGSSIIAYVAKTIVGVIDWGLTPQAAIELPNVVARGDVVRVEETYPAELLEALADKGFQLDANRSENSGLHAIRRLDDGTLDGGADPRREGVVGQLE
ncbi:gamma-glutamyltransferase [Hyphobacterium marinum]|uniref:Glutathione hydrolase proenzyme n=1 Tax=Hyphobacterium marinum TaxID=3116574 RepID=A0ABU7LW98_9PROT|nr:gamma-glutamyltransferase [Hyphobacterium sp. Y6023]MEE2565838.1 gamma-glutamyltransferase [Hyphobacterium sp. Y6023]